MQATEVNTTPSLPMSSQRHREGQEVQLRACHAAERDEGQAQRWHGEDRERRERGEEREREKARGCGESAQEASKRLERCCCSSEELQMPRHKSMLVQQHTACQQSQSAAWQGWWWEQ